MFPVIYRFLYFVPLRYRFGTPLRFEENFLFIIRILFVKLNVVFISICFSGKISCVSGGIFKK